MGLQQPARQKVVSAMTVFGSSRDPAFAFPSWRLNDKGNVSHSFDVANKGDGLDLLKELFDDSVACVFFDPQYTGIMDEMNYGQHRQKQRLALPQMSEETITKFCVEIERILAPSGHLFLWVDKFHLVNKNNALGRWLPSDLNVVDMITWNKERIGMGYRTRRACEYLVVCQKTPKRAKGVWTDHGICDVWNEKQKKGKGVHTHTKPQGLIDALISATTAPNNLVVDPAAGSFAVLDSCKKTGRSFVGCDIMFKGRQETLP